ncbi:hypothetical protein [Nisaea nitritireducens]|uniref:hypothetical protein n=1 Tax=Nisaea nitritireducens TaxID=568392 RepID=UPI0018686C33|nr:hypothetical protein [Nisaea nitritireducens]
MTRDRRLAKSAERHFSVMCSDAGLLCHSATEDEMGWDFLVEFPPNQYSGPAESMPAGSQAYVQIKSTTQAACQTRIKLTNARQSSQQKDPWFVVLFHQPKDQELKIYALHYWDDLIYKSLKAVRQADLEGHKLNRKYISLRFDNKDDHTYNLLYWMEKTITQHGPLYNMKKRQYAETLGYEDGYGNGNITFSMKDEDGFIKQLLGINKPIEIDKFNFTPSRFGISDKFPLVEFKGGTASIGPVSPTKCRIDFRGINSLQTVSLDGQVFSTGLGEFDDRFKIIRVSAIFFEILWRLDEKSDFSINFDPDKLIKIKDLEDISSIMRWCHDGPVDIQLWIDEKRILGAEIKIDDSAPVETWNTLKHICYFFRTFFNADVEISAQKIFFDIDRLIEIQALIDQPSFSIDLNLNTDADAHTDSIMQIDDCIYSITEPFGDRICFSVIRRPVTEKIKKGRKVKVFLGNPKILQAYSVKTNNPSVEKQLNDDFNSIKERFKSNIFAIHNIRGYTQSNTSELKGHTP